jgi:hypothetical protein
MKETKVKVKNININQLLLFLVVIAITFGGCGDQQITSKWRTQDITIDGNDSDWGSSLVFYDDFNSLVGVQNDNDYLYLCLVTTDQLLERKIFMTGLTIWFDNTGKGDKKFGIRFPIMTKNMNRNAFQNADDLGGGRRREPDDGRESAGDNGTPPDNNKIGNMILRNQTEVQVIDSKNEATRMPISELKGIELKMSVKDYRLVYEFKIPVAMKNGFSYAVGANPGNLISIGLESGYTEPKKNIAPRENTSAEGGSESPTGEGIEGGRGDEAGNSGMYGGGRARGRRGEGGFNKASIQTVGFWADIKLSIGSN